MQPPEFAQRWRERAPTVSERAGYQDHWRDLCQLAGHPTPSEAGQGQDYTFERHVKKVGTKDSGFADVFKAGFFIAEYKGLGANLGKALQQATLYARELGNPPLIITSDLSVIEVNTNFTGTSPKTYRVTLDDIERDRKVAGSDLTALQVLRAALHDPAALDPRLARERITQDATRRIGQVAQSLLGRGSERTQVAHFLMRVVFAMFAEDVGLLERGLLTKVLLRAKQYPERSQGYFQELFTAMQHGGEFWGSDVRHFNGGLFDDGFALAVTAPDADALVAAAKLDWAEVEPSIFGTLFEDSLDAKTRSQRGAHYTSVPDIERVVDPVLMLDLNREWDAVKLEAAELAAKRGGQRHAIAQLQAFQQRLGAVQVLDPACGSGNFLYVALKKLLDLEHEVRLTAFEYGAGDFDLPPLVHPRQMLGIEVEPFAHELASITLWIGYFQWKRAHGGDWPTPVLERLTNIQHHDALLNADGSEFAWPVAEYIVGNPPFLGDKMMNQRLGSEYTATLRRTYGDRLPGQSDLVCYWPEKARAAIEAGTTKRAGFVTTNSIRGGKNRTILERIKATGDLFMAWPDEPWLQDGAAVRVSLFGFDDGTEQARKLNGQEVLSINADLSFRADVNQAQPLQENAGLSFIGTQKGGAFDIPGNLAHEWLKLPNPGGFQNSDVLKPWVNGMDLTRRASGRWIIDYRDMSQGIAERYIEPFEYVRSKIRPEREANKDRASRERWWIHQRSRPEMREALEFCARFIGIPRVAKHLIPVWLSKGTLPDSQVVVVARDDDFTFGVLNSSFHRIWARAQGTYMGVGNDLRYTPSTCFETFPFSRPTDPQRSEVEKWAKYVVQVREHLLTQDPKATLTGLYNAVTSLRRQPDTGHPASALVTAHERLDQAVAAAYGWEWPLSEDEVLLRLLALNLERAAGQG
ncbi:hypothetical protein GCM10022631_30350 [Deinococcus rubellus]|uniref:class I SAM-dependent DNA methyltransferase n=1 Tax=Deinococcus rubellus TaxID=1889240 RepID=UPI0031E4F44F